MALSHRFAFVCAALVGIAACHAPQAEAPASTPVAAAPQAAPPGPSPRAGATAVPAIDGRGYVDARGALVAAGWTPMPSPTCARDTFGDVPADRCTTQPDAPECNACTDTPELESCSGSGLCLMRFTHARVPGQLHVTVYGELSQRHAADGGLVVQGHELVTPTR